MSAESSKTFKSKGSNPTPSFLPRVGIQNLCGLSPVIQQEFFLVTTVGVAPGGAYATNPRMDKSDAYARHD